MEKCQIIRGLFVPADQESAQLVHPRVRSLYYPPTSFEASFHLERLGLFSTCTNMDGKTKFVKNIAHLVAVVAFVQALALWMLLGGLWTLDDEAPDGRQI